MAIRSLVDELGFDTIDFVGHDLGGGVGLRYAARSPDAIDRLVLSNSVAYDSCPIKTITDLGLPETARETSVEELQEMLDGLFRDTLLLWGTKDEFQPVEWAERLESDISSCELAGLKANHWVPEDRTAEFTEHLTDFLL